MLLKLILLFWCIFLVFTQEYVRTVLTPVGPIDGITGEDFTKFLGIPYALVDRDNPFAAAKPYRNFRVPFKAYYDTEICPQMVDGSPQGTILCLHLNVYTPNHIEQNATLPVMVFIHGGAFIEGDSRLTTYSPKFLIKNNVIVVTINYRLGLYGFLCFPNTEYNNQGLKDQLLAFKWVKNNIKSFGGDDENILLFGHSAGSISIDFHLLYNTDNSFNKVILQSGHAISPILNDATDAKEIVEQFGMDINKVSVEHLIKNISKIDTKTVIQMTQNYIYRPCVDGKFITNTVKPKNLREIKIMTGITSQEMLFLYPRKDDEFFENFDYRGELNKAFTDISDKNIDFIKTYYGNTKEKVINFTSQLSFIYPMERSIRFYVKNNATVYKYLFTYEGGRNYMKILKHITDNGTAHGDELGYLFDIPFLNNTMREDEGVIDSITLLWTNFAKYGDPTPCKFWPSVKWEPVSRRTNPYLQIGRNISLVSKIYRIPVVFWSSFYYDYAINPKGIEFDDRRRQYQKNNAYLHFSNILLLTTVIFIWVNRLN